jgi:hypothetical protein
VDLFNDSPIAARDVKVLLSVPNGVTTYTQSVDVGVVAEGAKVISGLSAVIGAGMKPGVYPFKFTVVMPGLGSIEKELNVMVDPQYVIGSYNLSTPHDYANNFDKTWTVSKPGSVAIKLHFSKFATEKRYDTVSIMDKNGNVVATYDGSVEPFWTVAVPGDTVKIRLKTDSSVTAYGFDIDKIAY